MTEGTGEAPVVAQVEATGGTSATDYEKRLVDLEAKHQANISALTSAEQKAAQRKVDQLRESYEARMSALQAQMDEVGKTTMGDDYNQVRQRYSAPDPVINTRIKAGTIYLEGEQMGLTHDEMKELIHDSTVTPESWKAAARELVTMRKLASLEAQAKLEREEHMKLIKSLVGERESATTQAKEEVRKARQELGADLIPSEGPDANTPAEGLRKEWEDTYQRILKEKGDKRVLMRAQKERFVQRGFDPDKESWYGKQR